jgi:hypothetical protein
MRKETIPQKISQASVATSVSSDGSLNARHVSTFVKKDKSNNCLTTMNQFPEPYEDLVIDGEWRRFNVLAIINSLHIR